MTGKGSPAPPLLQFWAVEPFAPLEGGARSCGLQDRCAWAWQSCTVMRCILAGRHAACLLLSTHALHCRAWLCALKHSEQGASLRTTQIMTGPLGMLAPQAALSVALRQGRQMSWS